MAIVLPRRKKRVDIFAPRKSVQDAKAKLGPAYFDPSLLECSRNAIELNKLVNKWEDIDKEKVKFIRELTREQNIIARSYKKNRVSMKDVVKSMSLEDLAETTDGKPMPPGFRFRSNGDLKPSLMSLPHVSVSESDENLNEKSNHGISTTLSTTNSKSNGLHKDCLNYDAVNYIKEMDILRAVIVDLCEELSKSKISLSKTHSGNIRSYLRSHTNEYTSVTNFTGEIYRNPNDRFAFQPGSSKTRNMCKESLNIPSSRVCTGCQFKLKQQSDDLQKLKVKLDKDILKRRWNYIPTGKYVQSSTALSSSTSLHKPSSSSSAVTEDLIKSKRSKPSLVQFRVDSETVPKKTKCTFEKHEKYAEYSKAKGLSKSFPCVNRPVSSPRVLASSPLFNPGFSNTTDSGINEGRTLHSSLSKKSALKSGSSAASDTYCMGRSLGSSISCGSRMSSERAGSRLLADYDSRLNLLKEFQAEHKKQCDTKVKQFLQGLDSTQKKKTICVA